MDVELKKEKTGKFLKDQEVKDLIKRSQAGNQEARDEIVEKNIRLSGLSSKDF